MSLAPEWAMLSGVGRQPDVRRIICSRVCVLALSHLQVADIVLPVYSIGLHHAIDADHYMAAIDVIGMSVSTVFLFTIAAMAVIILVTISVAPVRSGFGTAMERAVWDRSNQGWAGTGSCFRISGERCHWMSGKRGGLSGLAIVQ